MSCLKVKEEAKRQLSIERNLFANTRRTKKKKKIKTKMIKSVFKHFSCCYIIENEKEDEEGVCMM